MTLYYSVKVDYQNLLFIFLSPVPVDIFLWVLRHQIDVDCIANNEHSSMLTVPMSNNICKRPGSRFDKRSRFKNEVWLRIIFSLLFFRVGDIAFTSPNAPQWSGVSQPHLDLLFHDQLEMLQMSWNWISSLWWSVGCASPFQCMLRGWVVVELTYLTFCAYSWSRPGSVGVKSHILQISSFLGQIADSFTARLSRLKSVFFSVKLPASLLISLLPDLIAPGVMIGLLLDWGVVCYFDSITPIVSGFAGIIFSHSSDISSSWIGLRSRLYTGASFDCVFCHLACL